MTPIRWKSIINTSALPYTNAATKNMTLLPSVTIGPRNTNTFLNNRDGPLLFFDPGNPDWAGCMPVYGPGAKSQVLYLLYIFSLRLGLSLKFVLKNRRIKLGGVIGNTLKTDSLSLVKALQSLCRILDPVFTINYK